VRALYDRSRALGADDHRSHLIDALDDVLLDRATTLPDTFADFTSSNLAGGYVLAGLAKRRYGGTEPFGDLATGTRTRRLRTQAVTLDHLSAAFYRVRSGPDDPTSSARPRCRRAKLTVAIQGPVDLETPLYWAPFRPSRGKPRALPLNKGRAAFERPWTTCGGREVGVAVLNPSADVDRRTFKLKVRLEPR
jgi:hypothetical protein